MILNDISKKFIKKQVYLATILKYSAQLFLAFFIARAFFFCENNKLVILVFRSSRGTELNQHLKQCNLCNNLYIDRCSLLSVFLEETFEYFKLLFTRCRGLHQISTHTGHQVSAVNKQVQWKTTAGMNALFKNRLMPAPISLVKSLKTNFK